MQFHPYQNNFPELFSEEKARIQKVIGDFEIEHIGSTAIPGMAGKGIIDIALLLNDWKEADKIVPKLQKIGYSHLHPLENGRIFLSSIKESKIGDCHIHIVLKGSEAHQSLVSFGDYFLKHPDEVEKYSKLKKKLWEKSKGNRQKYGKLKEQMIKKLV